MEQSLADSDMQVKKSQEEYLHVTEGLQQQLRMVTEEYNHYQNTSEEIKMELSKKNNDFEAKILALGAELRQRDSTIDVMSSESVGLQSRITALTEDVCKLSEAKSELETRLREERDNAVGSVRRAEEEVSVVCMCSHVRTHVHTHTHTHTHTHIHTNTHTHTRAHTHI